jgi:monoamine oxidase
MSDVRSEADLRFIVIGADMAGILAAIKLKSLNHGEPTFREADDGRAGCRCEL